MGRRIDAHGARTSWSLYGLDDLEFSSCLPCDRQSAVPTTGKSVAVEFSRIDATANREIGKDLPVIRTNNDQLLWLPTPDKEAASSKINRHSDR